MYEAPVVYAGNITVSVFGSETYTENGNPASADLDSPSHSGKSGSTIVCRLSDSDYEIGAVYSFGGASITFDSPIQSITVNGGKAPGNINATYKNVFNLNNEINRATVRAVLRDKNGMLREATATITASAQ